MDHMPSFNEMSESDLVKYTPERLSKTIIITHRWSGPGKPDDEKKTGFLFLQDRLIKMKQQISQIEFVFLDCCAWREFNNSVKSKMNEIYGSRLGFHLIYITDSEDLFRGWIFFELVCGLLFRKHIIIDTHHFKMLFPVGGDIEPHEQLFHTLFANIDQRVLDNFGDSFNSAWVDAVKKKDNMVSWKLIKYILDCQPKMRYTDNRDKIIVRNQLIDKVSEYFDEIS
jgi:hypothetical protein